MLAKLYGSALHGVEAYRITVEVSVSEGLGYFITGLPDDGVKESLSRIAVAIKALGYHMPRTKISVNLSPADVRKTGSGFDLPIALGILLASGQVQMTERIKGWICAGELGLDGTLHPVRGTLCMAFQARNDGAPGLIIPEANGPEGALVKGLTVLAASNLKDVIEYIQGFGQLATVKREAMPDDPNATGTLSDFRDVQGQETGKRALEIAAAGGHNVLLIGPPGVGKTMLAKRLPSILPPMTEAEILETSRIHSLGGTGYGLPGLVTARPFRSPHHTASDVALTGGGSYPLPGEISLAHNGVLFLDELYEFRRSAIEVLRQPLEEGLVRIARAKMSLEYPANFMLIAAMNPCFCGYYRHPTRACTCSKRALEYYHRKSASPLMERIDLHVEASSVPLLDLMETRVPAESSASIRERVIRARNIQTLRYSASNGVYCNARMGDGDLNVFCTMDEHCRRFLLTRMDRLQLSARSYTRVLKVSRTIADLAGSASIELEHVAEAISFRGWDRPVEVETKKKIGTR